MNVKKILTIFSTSALIFLNSGITAFAGWELDEKTRNQYYSVNGERLVNCVAKIKSGGFDSGFKFDENGVCKGLYTGWTKLENGKKRYFSKGTLARDIWIYTNGKHYYFDEKGYFITSAEKLQKIDVEVIYEGDNIYLDIKHQNLTEKEIKWGWGYDGVQKLVDGEWVKADLTPNPDGDDGGLNDIICILSPNFSTTEKINFTKIYKDIENGTYRIISAKEYSEPFEINT